MKKCSKCNIDKPFSEFGVYNRNPDGLRNVCKRCRLKDPEKEDERRTNKKMGLRWCNMCNQWLPIDIFYRNKTTPDGYGYHCKPCDNAARLANNRKNPEPVLARARARYHTEEGKQKVAVRVRAWRAANPERRKEQGRRQRKSNPSKLVEQRKREYENNRIYYQEKNRKWHKEHPEEARNKAKRRRAMKNSAPGTHTLQEWQELKAHYDYRCLCCNRQEPEIVLTEDHIVPLSCGGSDYITNIQPLCLSCNCSKGDKSVDYR